MKPIEYYGLSWLNPLFYQIRNTIRINRPIQPNKNPIKTYPYTSSRTEKKAQAILKTYEAAQTIAPLSSVDYQINLYLFDLMSQTFKEETFPDLIRAIDVGSKNFHYAPVLHSFYRKKTSLSSLEGIEIDAFRRYQSFYSRQDYAAYYIRSLDHTHYLPMDFLHYSKKAYVITMFLPFVFERPLLVFGLPLSAYQPETLMKHAYEALEEGGYWLITNQGKEEQKKQHEILDHLGISYRDKGPFYSPFFQFQNTHYVTLIKK